MKNKHPPFFFTVFNSVYEAKKRYISIKDSGKTALLEKAIYDAMYQLIKDLNLVEEFKSYEQMLDEAKK